jgi:hypothetical protein
MHQVFDGRERPAFGGVHYTDPFRITPSPIKARSHPSQIIDVLGLGNAVHVH